MSSDRFLRSKKERNVLFRAANGLCVKCGKQLDASWHADHSIPFRVSQTTDYVAMQAMCPSCNQKKGAKLKNQLREWQRIAWDSCQRASTDFFVEATPGAGKTTFGCHVASSKIEWGVASRLVVVVPTTSLKEQWAESLHRFDVDAEPEYKGSAWPGDFQAICVTYQQVACDPQMFAFLMGQKATVVILDEIHHCGDDANWGQAIQTAFSKAVFRLALSGTPFRSDKDKIPFLRYVDGKAQPDEVYGYGDGLRDKICRHVFFPRQGGMMEWSSPQGAIKRHTFDDELQEAEANQRLRTALTTGDWMKQTLLEANAKLNDLRREDADAAGLVIAIDQFHAKRIQRLMASSLGVEAVCVLSDDPDSHQKIKHFRDSASPWIIAVKMVSEGVDIPRLRVGVYATTVKTEMFFRQAVGRFVRVEKDHDDPTAVVYIPDDPTLRSYAEEIRQQRIHQLETEITQERNRDATDAIENNHDASLFMPLSAEAVSKGTIFEEFTFTQEELDHAAGLCMGQCKPEVAAAILRRAGLSIGTKSEAKPVEVKRKSDVKKQLRELNSKMVRSIAYASGVEHAHINRQLNAAIGLHKIADATIEQLRKRLSLAESMALRAGVGNER